MSVNAVAALDAGTGLRSSKRARYECSRWPALRGATARREFDRHVAEHRADLLRFACWLTRDPGIAEDVVQESFLRAWRSWPALRDKSVVRSWLLTIVRRESARAFRRVRQPALDIDAMTDSEQYSIAVEDDHSVHDLQEAMLQLGSGYREPLLLQVLMGYSTAEIAQMLGIRRGAVLTRLCRARKKLAEAIAAHE